MPPIHTAVHHPAATGRSTGSVAIVTGAARGIGRAIAHRLARDGATVMLSDVDSAGAEAAASLCDAGLSAHFVSADVRDAEAWSGLIQQTLARHGRIDTLVNNAAIEVKHPPIDLDERDWHRAHDVNLHGVWLGCKAVLPTMLTARSGAIVNIASVHGHRIVAGGFPYSVMKAGVLGLTRALGVEYAASGVRVVAVSPGYIDSDPDWWATAEATPGLKAEIEAKIPARRLGTSDEVAALVAFLASDDARYITATTVEIDGGSLAQFHP